MLLDLEQRAYFALDAVAARMWEILADTAETADVVECLAGEFDVDRSTLEQDVEQFVEALIDRKLVHGTGV